MLEKIQRKEVDKRDKQLPQSFEQLIQMYDLDKLWSHIEKMTECISNVYPVGAIYISINNTDPSSLFGGTWEQIKDKFLLSAGDEFEAGITGGEKEHTLSTDELPSHTHGSKSISGTFDLRRYGTSSSSTDIIPGRSGIVTSSEQTWSGSHAYINASNNTQTNPKVNRVTVNATHEHNSVGGGTAHNNMPPYLAVYVWKRIS